MGTFEENNETSNEMKNMHRILILTVLSIILVAITILAFTFIDIDTEHGLQYNRENKISVENVQETTTSEGVR